MHKARENFFQRWSRRKTLKRPAAPCEPRTESSVARPARPPAPPTEADLARLDAFSDYAPFLGAGVPLDVRVAALRKLWSGNADLSAPDGLIDYAGDYTGGGAPANVLLTAYRIGIGHLTDEEAEAWAILGPPSQASAAPTSENETLPASATSPAPKPDRSQ